MIAKAERHVPSFAPLIVLLAFTGLRIREALGLRWQDVDLDSATIHVRGQLAVDDRTPKGYANTRRALDVVSDKLGVGEIRSHDFRRSLASFLIVAARADEAAVTGLLGHKSIDTTRRIYAGDWREAEERNALVLRQLADAGIGQ